VAATAGMVETVAVRAVVADPAQVVRGDRAATVAVDGLGEAARVATATSSTAGVPCPTNGGCWFPPDSLLYRHTARGVI